MGSYAGEMGVLNKKNLKMKLPFCFAAIFLILSLSGIELEKRILLDNKIEILLPKDFNVMPEEMRKLKYPSTNAPKLVLSDENGTVNIAFSITNSKANQEVITAYLEVLDKTMSSAHPDAEWKGKGIEVINGKKVGYLKLNTKAIDQPIYNYLFFTDLDGKLLIGTFNCITKLAAEWMPVADEIVKSLKVL